MLRIILNNKIRASLFVVLLTFLVLVRAFESQLFYDPLLVFFKKDFTKLELPALNYMRLFWGLLFRYTINTLISLGIIYVLYAEVSLLKFAFILYSFLFLVLIIFFFGVLFSDLQDQNWILFYIRRFIIQPLFLLLFAAGFYYQKQNK